jgi:hypothetical protein
LIVLVVLISLLVGAAIWQLQLASQDHGPFPAPTSPSGSLSPPPG